MILTPEANKRGKGRPAGGVTFLTEKNLYLSEKRSIIRKFRNEATNPKPEGIYFKELVCKKFLMNPETYD